MRVARRSWRRCIFWNEVVLFNDEDGSVQGWIFNRADTAESVFEQDEAQYAKVATSAVARTGKADQPTTIWSLQLLRYHQQLSGLEACLLPDAEVLAYGVELAQSARPNELGEIP